MTTAWEELDRINKLQWEQKNGKSSAQSSKEKTISNQKKTKKKSNEEESSSSDEELDGTTSKRKNSSNSSSSDGKNVKKRRVAIEHALLKMKESGDFYWFNDHLISPSVADLKEIADSESDDSDSNLKKKKALKAHQASSSGPGAGMLSASYMSGGSRATNIEASGEKKKLKKRTSRLGDVEWASATWGEERVKAVIKGIDKSVDHFPLLLATFTSFLFRQSLWNGFRPR